MNNLGIQKRVLIIALLPATIIAIALGTYFVISQLNSLQASLEERGVSIVRQLAPAAEFGVFSGSEEILRRLASSVLLETDVRSVRIRDVSRKTSVHVGGESGEYIVVSRIQGDHQPKTILSVDKKSLFFEAPIIQSTMAVDDYFEQSGDIKTNPLGNLELGMVIVEISLENTIASQRDIILRGGFYTLIGLFLTGLLAARIGRAVTDPILKIADGVQELEQGKLDTMIDTGAKGEIKILESGINSMATALRGAQDNLQDKVDLATSELRKTLQELENKNSELEVERKNAHEANQSKSRFLANMSHELRTPLNAIIGYSEMLDEELVEVGDTQYVPDIQKINSAGKHLLALINDILDLSKVEAGKMNIFLETTDIKAISQYTIATIQPLADRNKNKLTLSCPDDIGDMYSDVTKIRQVLFNLLSNACKFTSNGEVNLTAERVKLDNRDWIDFTVTDTGIGMNEEQMKNLFEAFSQADASISKDYGGTGLGLAICKQFSALMGGKLTVTSEAGKGSVFKLRLPSEMKQQPAMKLSEGDKETTQEQFSQGAQKAREGLAVTDDRRKTPSTVLVIDDDVTVHDMLNRLLSKEGFYVVIASSGEQGVETAIELQPDVVVLDVLMPGMDGWDVLTTLKNNPATSSIPIVMLSMVDDRSKGYALGVTDYIYKPVDREKLISALTRCVRYGDASPILIVDDDASLRELLTRTLEKEGWETICAHNGRAALEAVRARLPSVIILDLMMPEMDGFEFVSHLRKDPKTRDIPVVILTAMDLSKADEALLAQGVTGILKKGASSRDEVLALVQELVQSIADREPL